MRTSKRKTKKSKRSKKNKRSKSRKLKLDLDTFLKTTRKRTKTRMSERRKTRKRNEEFLNASKDLPEISVKDFGKFLRGEKGRRRTRRKR